MPERQTLLARAALATIISVYCLLGIAYATQTPKWQAPDEPAHYNYVAYLAENRRFPVLQIGDYPHEYLEAIKAAGFPPEMSVEPIRYEFHQPPLYYVLVAAAYRVASSLGLDAQFLALRLFSVLLGGILLLVAYNIVTEVFPGDRLLALTSTAMIATLPMHIAMSAAVNNDTLAELILALVIWLGVKEINAGLSARQTVTLGVLVALALLTKTTIYVPVILSVLLAMAVKASERGWQALPGRLGTVIGLGLLLSGWWFVRNAITYGGLDLLAWHRHDSVVSGQPTTAGWIAEHGLTKTVQGFIAVSFRSFWAQFGWMGVLIDSRLYQLLAVLSIAVGIGFVLWLARMVRKPALLSRSQRWTLLLLFVVFLCVATAHVFYNLKFVQHQGRYLFPALLPIALAFALGLLEWPTLVGKAWSRWFHPGKYALSLVSTLKALTFSLFYAAFVALDVVCLFLFIVPQLRHYS